MINKSDLKYSWASVAGIIVLCLCISCNNKNKSVGVAEPAVDNGNRMLTPEIITLGKDLRLVRHSDENRKYWDILEVNHERLDSLGGSFLTDTTENNIRIKNTQSTKALVQWNNYLVLSKDQVQVIGIRIYHLKTMQKLFCGVTEDLMVDTLNNELFLIRLRGNIRNYILHIKIAGDKIIQQDSIENNPENRKRLGLDFKQ